MTTDVALPGGGNAHDTWASLSQSQRTALEVAVHHDGRVVVPTFIQPRTLAALARRGLTRRDIRRRLTERGEALARWRRSPAGTAWVQEWTGQHQ